MSLASTFMFGCKGMSLILYMIVLSGVSPFPLLLSYCRALPAAARLAVL